MESAGAHHMVHDNGILSLISLMKIDVYCFPHLAFQLPRVLPGPGGHSAGLSRHGARGAQEI